MEMEWTEIEGKLKAEELALVTSPDKWFSEFAPYYFVYGHTTEGSVFNTMLLGLDCQPEETLDKFVSKLPMDVDIEIQKRDGYSYPVCRYKGD